MAAGSEVLESPQSGYENHRISRALIRVGGLFRGGPRELLTATEKRVPFLDALRALAVLLVINRHLTAEFANKYGANLFTRFPLSANGWIGVDLFFVLSGYFIGSQLWKELDRSGTISIGQFMMRRGLRIWPLYFFIFCAVALVAPVSTAAKHHGWTDLVFATNYVNHGIVSGSWSLCSEEQFYLLTPIALWILGPLPLSKYRNGLAWLLGLICVIRAITYFELTGHFLGRHPAAFEALYYPFHTHCDGLILGLIVANLMVSRDKIKGILGRPTLLVALSAVLLVTLVVIHVEAELFVALAIFFAALVWWGVRSETKRFRQPIFYVLSRLSFGMYLNHEYMQGWVLHRILPGLGLLRMGAVMASMFGFLFLTVCSMGVAVVTFCLIEHPFLTVRAAILGRRAHSPLMAH